MKLRSFKEWFRLIPALALAVGLPCVPMATHGETFNIAMATGLLGPGAIGLFNFSLTEDIAGSGLLIIGTTGSKFDTEIALYDSIGHLVATNDNMTSKNPLSQLSFGANNGLTAGNYNLVLSGFNTIFGDGSITPGTNKGGVFQLNVQSTKPVEIPLIPSYLAKDGNFLPASIKELELAKGTMEAGVIRRMDFTLQNDILAGGWLAIDTLGVGFDSEIALFDAHGKLLATNDDIAPRNPLSRLSFGLDGDNGRTLIAGDYTLLLGGFNTIFHDGLQATTSSAFEGDYAVYVQSSSGITSSVPLAPGTSQIVAEPSSLLLVGLAVFALLRGRR